MALDTSWLNMSNITHLFEYSIDAYAALIPRDAFIAMIVTFIVIGLHLASDYNIRLTFAVLLLFDLTLAVILATPVIFAYCIVSAMIGAYALYKSFYG